MMTDSEKLFAAEVMRLFNEIESKTLPSAAVECVRSYGIAEDGETLLVLVDLADGRTVSVGIAPGKPIFIGVVAESERPNKALH